jgi:hypothetical protein
MSLYNICIFHLKSANFINLLSVAKVYEGRCRSYTTDMNLLPIWNYVEPG